MTTAFIRFLEATVLGLEASQPASVRISAVRAVHEYSAHLLATGNAQLLAPYLTKIMDAILMLATQFSSEVLCLVLETLQGLLKVRMYSGTHVLRYACTL